jgi:hypothetical protein
MDDLLETTLFNKAAVLKKNLLTKQNGRSAPKKSKTTLETVTLLLP